MFKKCLLLSFLLFLSSLSAIVKTAVSFDEWKNECFENLLEYSCPLDHTMKTFPDPIISFKEFNRALSSAFNTIESQLKEYSCININEANEDPEAENYSYLQKVVVKPNSTIFIFGDFHGSLHSLLRNLDRLKDTEFLNNDFSLKKGTYLFFLGDYVDRGRYGCEVLYTLSRLKEKNPYHVFIGKGNHEDVDMSMLYGFQEEIKQKHSHQYRYLLNLIDMFFTALPEGTFVGSGSKEHTNYIFLCHGMPAFGFEAQPLLNHRNHQTGISFMQLLSPQRIFEKQYKKFPILRYLHKEHILSPYQELTWGDLSSFFEVSTQRGALAFPPYIVEELLRSYSDIKTNNHVYAVFRGHQHSSGMNGCFNEKLTHYENPGTSRRLTPYSISTLITAPEGIGNGIADSCDSFISISTAEKFEEWKFTPYEFHVPSSLLTHGGKVSKKYDSKIQKQKYHWEIVLGKRDR